MKFSDSPIIKNKVQTLYDQGPRAVFEAFVAIADKGQEALVSEVIYDLTTLPPDTLKYLGCAKILHLPLQEVPR